MQKLLNCFTKKNMLSNKQLHESLQLPPYKQGYKFCVNSGRSEQPSSCMNPSSSLHIHKDISFVSIVEEVSRLRSQAEHFKDVKKDGWYEETEKIRSHVTTKIVLREKHYMEQV